MKQYGEHDSRTAPALIRAIKPALREDCAITGEMLAAVVSTFSVDSGTFATVVAMRPVATVAASGRPAGAGTRAPAFFFDSKIIMQLRRYLQQT
jgi:hypothetical protein